MNGSLVMLAVIGVGVVLLVLVATVSALHGASRRGSVRRHSCSGDGGSSAWSGWSGDGGSGSCEGGGGSCGGGGGD